MPTHLPPLPRRTVLAGAGAAGLAAAAAGPAGAARPTKTAVAAAVRRRVRTIVVNGSVFTGTGLSGPEAVAVGGDGRIVAVGTNREIRSLADRRTAEVDAGGGTIMAGIHDGHMHPLGAAAASLNPSLRNAELTVPELQAILQDFLDDTADQEPDGWLQVTDWSPVGLLPAGTVADRSMLDALRTRRPIYLQGSDFHNSWVNTRALELAGVTSATPDPAGGEIVRDATGQPTGLLKDNAQGLVRQAIPEPTEAALEKAYTDMADYLLSMGITSFQDAVSGAESLETYRSLLGRGLMRQQVVPALRIPDELLGKPGQAVEMLARLRRQYGDVPGLHLTTTKVFADGVIEFPAQTAALLEPYLDENGKPTKDRGDLYVPKGRFERLAVRLAGAGWQIHTHAIGDRAVRTALDAYQAADAAHGRASRRLRHTITHLELVDAADRPRFARLEVLASMQLQWAVRNQFTQASLRPYIGEERFRQLYPARSLQRLGATLVGGSDWPVDQLSPFNQIASAIDRTDHDGNDTPLGASERINRAASLRMHTWGGAHQMHLDDARGTVEPGMVGDLVVLDRDLGRVGTRSMRRTQVSATLVRGRVVHDSSTEQAQGVARRAAAAFAAVPAAGDVHRVPHAACEH